ncbi:PREDICTED: chromosome-associated kinesin KIF4 [Populus euphratica]|uniref:Chromosome-associated kinesin KIF4 n=1 Tax=Populus euphratica TaxID=75702 RepID=A0AAJ6TST2_POPEU|nr:PREDICTED: chromosome-associated kinesin KIF4 [Populus euphratica]
MKKGNRRSKRSSIADSSSPSKDESDQPKQNQDCDKRVHDLEKENEALKREIEELKEKDGAKISSPISVCGSVGKRKQDDIQKLRNLEEQVMELKKKLNAHSQLSKLKQKNGESGRPDEIQRLKAQKVQLLCKMKLDSVQFRLSKASLEREVLQMKKEQRRNQYEMRKLLALNQRQKLVLQRKTEEASMAAKRLKCILESRKAFSQKNSGVKAGNNAGSQGIELELKVAARVEEIRSEYERQMEEMDCEVRKFEEEAEKLRLENYRCLLQDKEVECTVRDSELRDLKEEVTRLSSLVSRLGMAKAQVNSRNPQVGVVQSSFSVGSSIELSGTDTYESEGSGGNTAVMGKSASGVCCSCSKKSLCKTTKCECRAAGGSCGACCGCAALKCTNRKVSSKADDSQQSEVAQKLHVSSSSETGKDVIMSQSADLNNDLQPLRKPLHEIGNAQMNSSPIKPVKKTRKQKSALQLDTTSQSCSLPENAEGPRKMEKVALADIPLKLTRGAKRSVAR